MPGHKGRAFHGLEKLDITEIRGADYLFEAQGIIGLSERQTAQAFGTARTLYSTEGSSLCIKTMLGIVNKCRKNKDQKLLVAAVRNVHKAFVNACILLDAQVRWVYPESSTGSLCSSPSTAQDIEKVIAESPRLPDCVYVTSPDYLGYISDIRGISAVCRRYGIPLLCDNAHGAYLGFLEENLHPIALGADMCCDSAHKTLPCYTGGAYLHISKNAANEFSENAKTVMSLFASTSPSYLILQSLDRCGELLAGDFGKMLKQTVDRTQMCRERLSALGWKTLGDEPCKLTINAPLCGISGDRLGEILREKNIEPEYTDDSFVVLMTSVFTAEEDYLALEGAMKEIPVGEALEIRADPVPVTKAVMSMREAAFATGEMLPARECVGRVAAMTLTGCQPSVPIAVSGEVITEEIAELMERYGTPKAEVVIKG